VEWGLELKDQLRQVSGHILLWQTWTGQDSSYTQRMEHSFCKRGDSRITWKQQIDAIITKVFRTCIGIYPHLKSERLSSNSKITHYKALMRPKMTYSCSAWKFAADNHVSKLQRL
jgi:hypothetical protein